MQIIPFIHEGLGNSSYLIGLGDGTAVAVDPDRSAGRYIDAAAERGWRLTAVFETHVHADFVTGASELWHLTGAEIYAPTGSGIRYAHTPVFQGQKIALSGIELECIATPGHTPEHVSYVFRSAGRTALFSGGSLIAGGAARTDLISPAMTEHLTRAQYRTLTGAFSHLPDTAELYPTHGGGSFCSAGAAHRRASTLGWERASNPLLRIRREDAFLRIFRRSFPSAPDYFFRMRAFNQAGPRLRRDVPQPPPLSPQAFDGCRRHSLVIDVRPADAYAQAHVPGSLSIRYRSSYAVWLGWLAPPGAPLLFVVDSADLPAVVEESMLIGHETFAGWLEGGMQAWREAGLPVAQGEIISPLEARSQAREEAVWIDVREPSEFAAGHIEGAVNIPLGSLGSRASELTSDRRLVVYCAAGDRSTTAVSLLEQAGMAQIFNLRGGIGAWQQAQYPVAAGR